MGLGNSDAAVPRNLLPRGPSFQVQSSSRGCINTLILQSLNNQSSTPTFVDGMFCLPIKGPSF